MLTVTLFLARGIIAGVFQAAYVYTPEVTSFLESFKMFFVEKLVMFIMYSMYLSIELYIFCFNH